MKLGLFKGLLTANFLNVQVTNAIQERLALKINWVQLYGTNPAHLKVLHIQAALDCSITAE